MECTLENYNIIESYLPGFVVFAHPNAHGRRIPRIVGAGAREVRRDILGCIDARFAEPVTETNEAEVTAGTNFGFRVAR